MMNNETQTSNPLIRFLNEHVEDTIKDIKKSEEDTKKEKDNLAKTLFEAHGRTMELIRELL